MHHFSGFRCHITNGQHIWEYLHPALEDVRYSYKFSIFSLLRYFLFISVFSKNPPLPSRKHHVDVWTTSWKVYQSHTLKPSVAHAAPLGNKRLSTHALPKNTESALATQIRTGKKWTYIADFLHRRRVPGFTSPTCPCRWHRQTLKHVIMFCRLISGRDLMFREAGMNNYQLLIESPKPMKALTSWLMKSGSLGQISLAVQLLYNTSSSSTCCLIFSFSHGS